MEIMELLELKNRLLAIFEINDISMLGEALMAACLNGDDAKYDACAALGLENDFLQEVYQYYLADRAGHKQDFTPASLAILMARLAGDDGEIADLCAGSGALSLQAWERNKHRHLVCYEIDGNVIPFLLFNLAIRNISAEVWHGDALADSYEALWRVNPGSKYGKVKKVEKWEISQS